MAKKSVWVIGHHAVKAVLEINPERALSLWVAINSKNTAQQEILSLVEALGISIHPLDKQGLAKRCGSEHNQGVALQVKPTQDGNENDLEHFVKRLAQEKKPLLLILDQVQDPHNFGACLRTADAAGVDAMIVAKDNACPMTPIVQKVASGAAETLPIYRVTNLARAMDMLKQHGIWMIGTSDKASHSIYQEDLSGAVAMVMGTEGKGLRQLTENKCDSLVSIPMAGTVVSSLNVSVATGVCLYEAVRQRDKPNQLS